MLRCGTAYLVPSLTPQALQIFFSMIQIAHTIEGVVTSRRKTFI